MSEEVEVAATEAPHANSSQHNLVFAAWLVATYGQTYLRSGRGVVDVAGGGGLLSFELAVRWGIPSTVVDTRPAPALKGILRRRMRKLHKQRLGSNTEKSPEGAAGEEASCAEREERDPLLAFVRQMVHMPVDDGVLEWRVDACLAGSEALPYKYLPGCFPRALDEEPAMEAEGLAEPSLFTGMHADQATEAAVDAALAARRPFAVVPCCVFKELFPHRQLPPPQDQQGDAEGAQSRGRCAPVATYSQLLQYLQAKDARIRRAQLPFLGRNTVLYILPADVGVGAGAIGGELQVGDTRPPPAPASLAAGAGVCELQRRCEYESVEAKNS